MSELIPYLLEQLRSENDPIQQSALIAQLKRQGVATKAIAQLMKVSPVHVSQLLRINKLPEMVLDGYYSKLVSLSHLIFLSRLRDDVMIERAYEQVLAGELSALATEQLVRELLYGIKTDQEQFDHAGIIQLQQMFEERGVSLTVVQTRIGARVQLQMKGATAQTTPWLMSVTELLWSWLTHDTHSSLTQNVSGEDSQSNLSDQQESTDKTLDQSQTPE
jgi:hypothetical protein